MLLAALLCILEPPLKITFEIEVQAADRVIQYIDIYRG